MLAQKLKWGQPELGRQTTVRYEKLFIKVSVKWAIFY